ncbi:MAG: hypothetical protein WCQ66_02385 [Sphaerochaetaceae bacterium]
MKRLVFCALAIMMLVGCASISKEDPAVLRQQQDEALRAALKQASDKVPATLFSETTTDEFLPGGADVLSHQKEVPLMQTNLVTYRTLCQNAFRTTLLEMPDVIERIAEQMEIPDPKALIDKSDDSMSVLLSESYATVLKKEIGLRLEDELTQARTVLDRTMEDYRIWDKGKTKLGRTSLPSVSAPSMQAYTDLFFTTYVASLQTQEIDVRTTPRLEGTGSLYEFFAREKAGKR